MDLSSVPLKYVHATLHPITLSNPSIELPDDAIFIASVESVPPLLDQGLEGESSSIPSSSSCPGPSCLCFQDIFVISCFW